MTYSFIETEVIEHVGLIRLNHPKALNALNSTLVAELIQALQAFDADKVVGAMVLTGNQRAFAAGADIKEMMDESAVSMQTRDFISHFDQVAKLRKPLIAAVSGFCLGGGCELAMLCDMIIASPSAVFGQPEIGLGVIPGAGGTQRLTRAVGKVIAMEMVLNDRRLSADEALQFGLINHVASAETYLDEALDLAAEIAGRAPLAVQVGKEMVNHAFETSLSEGVAAERRAFYALFDSEDQIEGMQAFLEKRSPNWQGK
jgi:enoyl-CoA hydratase